MDTWPKVKLISEILSLEEKLKYYQTKLRDLVTAYKSLVKEKAALESSLTALKNVCNIEKPTSDNISTNNEASANISGENETIGEEFDTNLNSELTTLMKSLATLSAEKCRMEASFQADKKLLRQEKEKHEYLIKELQEKLKKVTYDTSKEIEHLKSKLIIEKHEREKEQNDHIIMMSELQRLLSQEKEEKLILEKKITELTPKFQLLANKEEVERVKESDMTEKFMHLQRKHLIVLDEERKRIVQAERESKDQIAIHERRVANLETRLAELSHTIADYHKQRLEDQNEITKLKAYIADLDSEQKYHNNGEDYTFLQIQNANESELKAYVNTLVEKILNYKTLLLNANKYLNKPIEINTLFCDKCQVDEVQPVHWDVHRKLLNDYETLLQQYKESSKTTDEIENLKIKIRVLQDQNLVLNRQLEETITGYENQLKTNQDQMQSMFAKHEQEIEAIHSFYKARIVDLETQLQKQRNRTLILLDEKEQEVSTLKSSFQIFLPGNKNASNNHSQLTGVLEGNLDLNSSESPHILHYAHELARRNVDIKNLQKACNQLETTLHETNKELVLCREKSHAKIFTLKQEIDRLERCQTREGANLEYLKNVTVNYFLSQNVSQKRHMFNAIATVLKFSDIEIQSIKKSNL